MTPSFEKTGASKIPASPPPKSVAKMLKLFVNTLKNLKWKIDWLRAFPILWVKSWTLQNRKSLDQNIQLIPEIQPIRIAVHGRYRSTAARTLIIPKIGCYFNGELYIRKEFSFLTPYQKWKKKYRFLYFWSCLFSKF